MPGTRLSTSAIPEHMNPDFGLPEDVATEFSTRHSVTYLPSAKIPDTPCHHGTDAGTATTRESNFSDVSGVDALHFWQVEDDENSRTSTTPRSMARNNDPYQGVTVEVNNHSINNQGVVMYHVDIKGPDGMLSTYTIRRRYRAFRNLHIELTRLLDEYTKRMEAKAPASSSAIATAVSPVSDALLRQQSFTRVVLPPLPSAGVWTYLKRHDVRLVEQRKKRFQEILRIAIRHPATRSSSVMDAFLSVAPSEISQRGSSYVSLQDYSVPVIDRHRESIERRQRKLKVLETRRQRTNSEAEMR